MTTFDYGPVEFYAIAFEGDRPRPEVLQAIGDLVESGTVHVLDLVYVRRSEAGDLSLIEIADTEDAELAPALGLGGIAGSEDIEALTEELPPGSAAAILVVELAWAKRFSAALYDAGGAVIARQGIPAPVVNAFLSEHA